MLVYLLFGAGLALLVVGGDWLVRGAVGLAEKLAIPPVIIGLTIVAFGTSAPELVISVKAAVGGSGGLAVGNVVGSNIANVLLVLGVPAIIAPIVSPRDDVKTTLVFLIVLTIIFMVQMSQGPIGRIDGLVLLVGLAGFLFLQFRKARTARSNGSATAEGPAGDYHDEVSHVPVRSLTIAAFLAAGIVALGIGASLTVDSAVEIAARWNVPEEVIGLTIVAIGTSLPELATGIMAARNNSGSVAIGNIVGSNLFNIAAIMGITTVVAPVVAGDHIVRFDMWAMLVTTLFLIALPIAGMTIGRKAGILLTALYLLYLAATAVF